MLIDTHYFPLIVVSVSALAAWATHKIDAKGAITGALISYMLILGVGWLGLATIGGFFVVGTLASVWKIKEKKASGLAEKRNAQRGTANVLANSLIPAVCAGIAFFFPATSVWMEILVAVGFASATSDTLSSEMGNIYGTEYINIVTLKPDEKGKDGVISLEGLLFGMLGSMLMAMIYYLFTTENQHVPIIIIAGFAGNLLDSLLGATLQRKGYLNNHAVNLLNTTGACLLALMVLVMSA